VWAVLVIVPVTFSPCPAVLLQVPMPPSGVETCRPQVQRRGVSRLIIPAFVQVATSA